MRQCRGAFCSWKDRVSWEPSDGSTAETGQTTHKGTVLAERHEGDENMGLTLVGL